MNTWQIKLAHTNGWHPKSLAISHTLKRQMSSAIQLSYGRSPPGNLLTGILMGQRFLRVFFIMTFDLLFLKRPQNLSVSWWKNVGRATLSKDQGLKKLSVNWSLWKYEWAFHLFLWHILLKLSHHSYWNNFASYHAHHFYRINSKILIFTVYLTNHLTNGKRAQIFFHSFPHSLSKYSVCLLVSWSIH